MGYDNAAHEQKTLRVLILSILMVVLGLVWLGSKTSDCNPAPASLSTRCHDTFNVLSDSTVNYSCPPGSKAEIVVSPPAPKAGVICHCITTSDAPATSATH